MRHFAFAALIALAPSVTTAAEITPGLFGVTGVDAGSVLNVRAEPTTEAPVLGRLPSDARDIEVVAHDPGNTWGRINFGEGNGWVSLEFLRSQGDLWAADSLPPTLRCFGTEPFWSLTRAGDDLIHSSPDGPDRPLRIDRVTGGAGGGQRVVVARDGAGTVTLGIAPEACGDGMSDRAFGLGARVSDGDAPVRVGCCSVAPLN